jgi:hypothetical protein
MLVLTAEQCSRVMMRATHPDATLLPLLLTDGRYGLPDNVVNDPRHANVRTVLRQGTTVADGSVTPVPLAEQGYALTVDGKKMHLGFASGFNPLRGWPFPHHGPFEVVSSTMVRFEARYNDDHLSYDWVNNRRRVELAQGDETGPKMGDTFWTSWSNIFTDKREPLFADNQTVIHQWFHTGIGPFVYVSLGKGSLEVATKSSADDGAYMSRYSQPFNPATGTPQNFVIRGVLAEAGHLDVWLNGTQIVNIDAPLGFFNDPAPDDPAYLHIASGIYQGNVTDRAVLYLANLEFGTTDLSARVAAPLPVTAPPSGWV